MEGLKSENVLVRYKAKQFMGILDDAEPIKEFDMDLFFRIIEKMTVFEREKIVWDRGTGELSRSLF